MVTAAVIGVPPGSGSASHLRWRPTRTGLRADRTCQEPRGPWPEPDRVCLYSFGKMRANTSGLIIVRNRFNFERLHRNSLATAVSVISIFRSQNIHDLHSSGDRHRAVHAQPGDLS